MAFPVIWGFFGVLFIVLTPFIGGSIRGSHALARGFARLLLATLAGCALLLNLQVGDLDLIFQTGILAFLFIGAALLNQWYWSKALHKELLKEEPLPGVSRSG